MPGPLRWEVGPRVSAWQELEPSGRSSCWPEMPFEAEGQRSWCFCLFLPSNLMPDLPGARSQEMGDRQTPWEQGTGGRPRKGANRELTSRED